ncbi:hypothetical protein KAX02_05405 [candidate division WOR-3 bacterium]|nr:hypothetical protein [candidate division WOR-3 bacterium]
MAHDTVTGHINAALTTLSLRLSVEGLVADNVSKRIKSKKQSDKIRVYDMSHMRQEQTLIGHGGKAGARKYSWGLDTDKTFFCEGYGLYDTVTRKEMANYDKPLDAKKDTNLALTEIMALDRELRVAAQLTDTGIITKRATLSGTSQWSDISSGVSDPLSDILAAALSVRTYGGKKANFILMDYEVAMYLGTHPDMVSLVTSHEKVTYISVLQVLKDLYGLEPIIAGGQYNTAKLGAAASLSPVWGKDVLVGYRHPNPGLRTWTLGGTFNWTPGRFVSEWPSNNPEGTNVKVEEWGLDEKVLVANCGYLIKAAIA